ncbi:hypothetical protein [uncultured Methanobrevibacter sp.]|uniref:hypothetical protein n=1 Tax=uncultured Methanobrevibacter sp. TaxID=253161 RepID=UPI002627F3C6|nr:hypothetical protein [uncultured Methanobrevibacter sp.]
MTSTIICENCGKIYKDLENCPKCGTSNPHYEEEKDKQDKNKPSIICQNCGKIYKDSEICPNCGTYTIHNEEEIRRIKEENKKIKEEREQEYLNKIDKREKINEEYGFTNDEIFKIYHDEAKQADKVYRAYVTYGISRIEKVNGRFLASN